MTEREVNKLMREFGELLLKNFEECQRAGLVQRKDDGNRRAERGLGVRISMPRHLKHFQRL
jgi:hypothetical protein